MPHGEELAEHGIDGVAEVVGGVGEQGRLGLVRSAAGSDDEAGELFVAGGVIGGGERYFDQAQVDDVLQGRPYRRLLVNLNRDLIDCDWLRQARSSGDAGDGEGRQAHYGIGQGCVG